MSVLSSVIHRSSKVVPTQMLPTVEWINKIWYIHNEVLSGQKQRNEVLIMLQHGGALES